MNGGYLKYIDRDTYPNPEYASHIRVELNGRNVTREFIIQWDIGEPYHQCVQENGSKCTSPPISVDDVTNKVNHYVTVKDILLSFGKNEISR